ncbi:MAG: HAMP domain-containing protein [Mycobacteriaceae bacterium]|nr:HAMP domain-containing protein [Mycobacteriaceae bacterium]
MLVNVGVRGRILAIALVPSLTLLGAGVGAAGYLVRNGLEAREWAVQVGAGTASGLDLADALQQERRLALLKVAGAPFNPEDLLKQRKRLDAGLARVNQSAQVPRFAPDAYERLMKSIAELVAQLPAIRARTDAGSLPIQDAYSYYNHLVDALLGGFLKLIVRSAPDREAGRKQEFGIAVYELGEAITRSAVLAGVAASRGGLAPALLADFSHEIKEHFDDMAELLDGLPAEERAKIQALAATPAWQQLIAFEDSLIRRVAGRPAEDVSPARLMEWANAAVAVNTDLGAAYAAHQAAALHEAKEDGNRITRNSLIAGGAVLLVSLLAFGLALWMSRRVIGRLRRLRNETLALADEQLPDIMNRVRNGESVNVAEQVTPLDYGKDEIGEVADAFNRAQLAALEAAETEASTRSGVQAVFLNIAHRSQVVLHRQLEVLGKAEYEFDDPAYLDVLFTLDHLATRERRNAENLIILGGEQPGRRWNNPVPLTDLVRSAIAETEHFARVHTAPLPDLRISGAVVADLVHLIAELVDNATSFSPPETRVEVSGAIVGKGVAVEITDRGLGMTADELAEANEQLATPSDFNVTTLSSDSRLGLFVTAKLAARTGSSVRLSESLYGGIRAIVIVPSSHLVSDPPAPRVVVEAAAPESIPTTNGLHANGLDANGFGMNALGESGPAVAEGNRPQLPRRVRHSAADEDEQIRVTPSADSAPLGGLVQSADEARDLFSAIEQGTRLGRSELLTEPKSLPDE